MIGVGSRHTLLEIRWLVAFVVKRLVNVSEHVPVYALHCAGCNVGRRRRRQDGSGAPRRGDDSARKVMVYSSQSQSSGWKCALIKETLRLKRKVVGLKYEWTLYDTHEWRTRVDGKIDKGEGGERRWVNGESRERNEKKITFWRVPDGGPQNPS